MTYHREADDDEIKEQHPHRGDWLREMVFGLNDGLVTTLVFIMAVSEVAPARLLVVVLGEVLAGGISMALGGYLSARTGRQVLEQRIYFFFVMQGQLFQNFLHGTALLPYLQHLHYQHRKRCCRIPATPPSESDARSDPDSGESAT